MFIWSFWHLHHYHRRWTDMWPFGRPRRRPGSGPCLAVTASILFLVMILFNAPYVEAIRCYVCGGATGRACEPIRPPGRRSPYVRPSPVPASDGSRQWEVCNDLINNRGCIKQVVDDVVLLRACWMQATDKCLVNGEAEVCTCNHDLCNASSSLNDLGRVTSRLKRTLSILALIAFLRTIT